MAALRTLILGSSRLAYRSTLLVPEHLVASTSRAAFHSTPRLQNDEETPQPAPTPQPTSAPTATTTTTLWDQEVTPKSRPRREFGPRTPLHPDEPSSVNPRFRRDGTPFDPVPGSESSNVPSPMPDLATGLLFNENRSVPRLGTSDEARPGGSMMSDRPRYAPITNDREDQYITHVLYINVTRNNVHLSFQDSIGKLGAVITGGSDKTFKGQGRSTFEAAHQAIVKMMGRIQEYSDKLPDSRIRIRLAFKGLLGAGREAVIQAIQGPTGDLFRPFLGRIDDRTPMKYGGNRARKARRI